MKKVLITGGSGFVGQNLSEAFKDDYEIYTPRHSELNVLDYDALEKYVTGHGIEVVIHGAIHVPLFNGQAEKELFLDVQMLTNIEKISRLVEKVIYFGSGAEFDKRFPISQVTEDSFGRTIPDSQYGLGKYVANLVARGSKNIYNLRLFGIFGKKELWELKFLSNACCKAVFDLPITIRRDCKFDFFYIEDLPKIVRWFIENKPRFHDYNICTGEPYWLSEYAEMIVEISGKEIPIQLLSQELNNDYSASNDRLLREIPDLVLTPIRTSLRELYEYYSAHKEDIDYQKLAASR